MSKDYFLKRGNEKPFTTHNAHYGDFGGGTQPPVYLDSNCNKIPEKETKWHALKKVSKKK